MLIFQKILKILFYIVLGIFFIVSVLHFVAGPLLKDELKKQVSQTANGQYSLQLDDLQLSLFKGTLDLKGVKFKTDTSSHFPGPIIFTDAEKVSLKGFSMLKYLVGNALIIDEVGGRNVNISLSLHPEGKTKKEEIPFAIQQLDIYPLIEDKFERVEINHLNFENLFVFVTRKNKSNKQSLYIENLDIRINNILIEEGMLFTPSRSFYSTGIEINGKEIMYTENGANNLKASLDYLQFYSDENSLNLTTKSLAFLKGQPSRNDTLLYFLLQDCRINGLSVYQIQEKGMTELDSILLKNIDFAHQGAAWKGKKEPSANGSFFKNRDLKAFSMGDYLPGFLKKVSVGTLCIEEVSGYSRGEVIIEDGNLYGENIFINELPAFSENRFLHSAKLESKVKQLDIISGEVLHHATLSNIEFSAAKGEANARTGQFVLLPKEKKSNEPWIELAIDSIHLDSILTGRIQYGELHFETIALTHPQLSMYIPNSPSSGLQEVDREVQATQLPQIDISPVVKDYFGQLSVGSLSLKDMGLKILKKRRNSSLTITIPYIELQSNNILIGPEEAFTETSSLYSKYLHVALKDFSIQHSGKSQWEADLNKLSATLMHNKGEFNINSVYFYYPQENGTDTLIRASLGDLQLNELEIEKLVQNKEAKISTLYLNNLEFLNNTDPSSATTEEAPSEGKIEEKNAALSSLNLGKFLPEALQQISIQDLRIQNVEVRQKSNGLYLENGKLHANNLAIGKKPAFAGERFMHAGRLESSFGGLSLLTGADQGMEKHKLELGNFEFLMDQGMGVLTLQNILIRPLNRIENSQWIDGKIDSFTLSGIDTRKLQFGQLGLGEIAIEHPAIVHHAPTVKAGSTKSSGSSVGSPEPPDLYPLIQDYLNEIDINNILVKQGDFRFSGFGESYYGLHLPIVNIAVEDIIIAPETAFDEKRILHSNDLQVGIYDMLFLFPDNVYSLKLDHASLSTSGRNMLVEGFKYEYSENYKKKLQEEGTNEVYRIFNEKLKAEEIDWGKIILGKGFESCKVVADGLEIYVYKDFNVPYEAQIKPMPDKIVRDINLPIAIKELKLNNMEVIYEEMKKGADTAGFVKISDLEGTIHNLTNVDSIIGQSPSMDIAASGRLMEKGYFYSHINVPLRDNSKKIRVTGSMDTLDVTELNRIVRYNSRIALKSGYFYKVNWDFEAGEEEANGKIAMSYENLKVQLSNPSSPDTTGIIKDIGSLLINQFVVESNIAEERNQKPESAYFEQKRNKEKSFFHFYVQSLLSGFIEILGIPFQ